MLQPISWVSPDVDTGLQLSEPTLSTDHSKSPGPYAELKSAKMKKKRIQCRPSCNVDLVYNQNDADVGESHQL
ncbi:hypothetical protein OROGR_018589 [Orobanche gracilis]